VRGRTGNCEVDSLHRWFRWTGRVECMRPGKEEAKAGYTNGSECLFTLPFFLSFLLPAVIHTSQDGACQVKPGEDARVGLR
jgi:hypothetical protein